MGGGVLPGTSQRPRWLRRRGGDAIVGVMRARPPPQQASDLFTAAADAKAVAPPETAGVAANPAVEKVGQPSPPRHLLPRDLPRALARLDDGEIDTLLAAVVEEAKRRDRVPASSLLAQWPEARQRLRDASRSKEAATRPTRASAQEEGTSLTRGQVNAVRAGFKAGVKVSMIARQFGLSQSEVRKALASEMPERKR
jgi:hypothetical protein